MCISNEHKRVNRLERILKTLFLLRAARKRFIAARLRRINHIEHLTIFGDIQIARIEGLHLSDFIYIGPGAHFWGIGDTYIGSNTIIGPGFSCINSNHNYRGELVPYGMEDKKESVVIGNNVWIGANVNVVPGVTIGDGAVIGMGTTVVKNVPCRAVVGSNELKIIGFRDEDGYVSKVEAGDLYLLKKWQGK